MEILRNTHESWRPFLKAQAPRIEGILASLKGEEKTPRDELIFRFARTDLGRVRAVWLGQDPYPQPGAATGRSFEVAGLTSWLTPIRQSSLRNIVRAICLAETGEELAWREVQRRIAEGGFSILPPDRLWDALEAQGVLFLNAYLTCRVGAPLSHKKLWEPFARDLVAWIDAQRGEETAWFLWGADARAYRGLIRGGRCYESRHPMMSGNTPDAFLKNPCFRETAAFIDWTGTKNTEN